MSSLRQAPDTDILTFPLTNLSVRWFVSIYLDLNLACWLVSPLSLFSISCRLVGFLWMLCGKRMALLNLVPSGLFFLDKEGSQHILKHLVKLHGKISLVSLGQNHKNYYEIYSKYCCQNWRERKMSSVSNIPYPLLSQSQSGLSLIFVQNKGHETGLFGHFERPGKVFSSSQRSD